MRTHRRQPTRLRRLWDSQARTLEWIAIAFSKYFNAGKKQLFLINWKLPWLSVKILIIKGLTFFFKLETNYVIILRWFLPYIHMNPPWVCMFSPSWTLFPPSAPFHPSGSSQCTSPEHPAWCIEPGLVIYFIYGNIHVSMLFSQIIPPLPSPTESKSLFFTSVSLLLSHI